MTLALNLVLKQRLEINIITASPGIKKVTLAINLLLKLKIKLEVSTSEKLKLPTKEQSKKISRRKRVQMLSCVQ